MGRRSRVLTEPIVRAVQMVVANVVPKESSQRPIKKSPYEAIPACDVVWRPAAHAYTSHPEGLVHVTRDPPVASRCKDS